MLLVKNRVKVLVFVLILLFLFSSVALANDKDIEYVYFERTRRLTDKIIVVDYQEAVDLKDEAVEEDDPKHDLYDGMKKGVFEALVDNKRVYLQTKDDVVIDYTKAINDNKSYLEALEAYLDDDDDTYVTSRPEADREMYYDEDEERVNLRDPDKELFSPEEYPEWLIKLEPDKDEEYNRYHYETWETISGTLFIEIQIDEEKFAEHVVDRTIHDVEIKGEEALERDSEEENVLRYYIGIPEEKYEEILGTDDPEKDDPDTFKLRSNDVRVRAGITWYD